MHESSVSPNFLEFLSALGWPVSVSSHAGWTGHVQTSWRSTAAPTNEPQSHDSAEHGGALYSGSSHVLYWADVSAEVAFIVPTLSSNPAPDIVPDANYNESNNGMRIFSVFGVACVYRVSPA